MNYVDKLKKLQEKRTEFKNESELRAALAADNELNTLVNDLSVHFLKTSPSNCQNCLIDSYILLNKLKMEEVIKKETCKYKLLAGVVLFDVHGDSDKMMTNSNITDELAEYHLKENPKCVKMFEKYPELDADLSPLKKKVKASGVVTDL